MNQENKYTILFQSLEESKKDEKNNVMYQVIEESNLIKEQSDFLKQFSIDNQEPESVGYTRT